METFLITLFYLLIAVAPALVVYVLIKKGKIKKQLRRKVDWSKLSDMAFALEEKQESRKNIDHCPHCGSHDIKIYREGYNYNKGFWLRAFDVKGGGYVAGMNSNRARCRCMNCGNDWATDYDYRLIDKK